MSAVLRAYGDSFDADTFLKDCTLPICAVKRKGSPVFPASQPDGRRHNSSGIHVSISDADFSEFPRQVIETIAFLDLNREQVARLAEFPGVERITLDFGVVREEMLLQIYHLPVALIQLAASCGLAI
jgi:hypothetical protein